MKLLAIRDKNGITIPVVPMSDYIDCKVLASTTHESIAVPSGMAFCCITPSADVYVKRHNTSFAVPSADVEDGTAPLFVPAGASRLVQLGSITHLGFVSSDACNATLEWFE